MKLDFHMPTPETDSAHTYSRKELCALLDEAEKQGFPLGKGSYVEDLTIGQLEMLVRGKTDA